MGMRNSTVALDVGRWREEEGIVDEVPGLGLEHPSWHWQHVMKLVRAPRITSPARID